MTPRLPIACFILITVVLDAMGIGLILPVMPDLIQRGAKASGSARCRPVGRRFVHHLCGHAVPVRSGDWQSSQIRFGRRHRCCSTSLFVMAADYLVMAAGGVDLAAAGGPRGGGYHGGHTIPQPRPSWPIRQLGRTNAGRNFGLDQRRPSGWALCWGRPLAACWAEFGTARAVLCCCGARHGQCNPSFSGLLILPETVTDDQPSPVPLDPCQPVGCVSLQLIAAFPEQALRLISVYFLYSLSLQPSIRQSGPYFTQAEV